MGKWQILLTLHGKEKYIFISSSEAKAIFRYSSDSEHFVSLYLERFSIQATSFGVVPVIAITERQLEFDLVGTTK